MSELLLPLFPLDLVLLPGVPLPLHIFEPRYKEMIRECLDQKRPFGIVRAKDESFVNIGCTADIMNVLKTYPDGRMNILVEGQKRFEGARPGAMDKSETTHLAYRLAGSLPFDPDFQQALLEMSSEAQRVRAIISFFEHILPVLHRNARAKHKAGGNGHVS